MDDIQRIVEGDGRVAFSWMEMDGKKAGLIPEMIKSDLVALEVPISFPGHFIDPCLPEGFKTVEKGYLGCPDG